jgi:hypothetical protein
LAFSSDKFLLTKSFFIPITGRNLFGEGFGYKLEDEYRVLTKEEAYQQLSHSASLFKAILEYLAGVSKADN